MIKKIFMFLGILLLSIASYAQQAQVKIDTVHIPVYYVRFFDGRSTLAKGPIYDIPYKNVVIPANSVRRKKIPLLYHNQKDNKFNGMFMMTEDNLVTHFGVITNRLNKYISDFTGTVNSPMMPAYFRANKKVPKYVDDIYNVYAGYWLDAVWIKYTITQLSADEEGWRQSYLKKVTGADGTTFNYYLLFKVNSSRVLD